jgi:hypothetical protein
MTRSTRFSRIEAQLEELADVSERCSLTTPSGRTKILANHSRRTVKGSLPWVYTLRDPHDKYGDGGWFWNDGDTTAFAAAMKGRDYRFNYRVSGDRRARSKSQRARKITIDSPACHD